MNTRIVLVLLFLVQISDGWFFQKKKEVFPNWNKLSTTFLKFSTLPMTEENAIDNGWTMWKNGCEGSSFFVGRRYLLDGDMATMLLFDNNGKIAGMQMGYPNNDRGAKNWIGGPIYDDGKYLYITAYFTNPQNICNGKVRVKGYVGDKLLFRTGENRFMEIPLREKDLDLNATKWVEGRCFYGMGKHYWYNIHEQMNCRSFFPFFIMYNENVLNAFGFAVGSQVESSRVEHPPASQLFRFFNSETLPKCLSSAQALSTQHVYLEKRPYFNFC